MRNEAAIADYVNAIDLERRAEWRRLGSFSDKRGNRPVQPPEVRKAKDRLRAARWRAENDAKKRPETATVALALLRAFAMHVRDKTASTIDRESSELIAGMLTELYSMGYTDLDQIKLVVKRLRNRIIAEREQKVDAEKAGYRPPA